MTDQQGNVYTKVEITLQPGGTTILTDNEGNYTFNNLSPGDYEVLIEPPNSSTVPAGNSSSVKLADGQMQTINFTVNVLPVEAVLVLGENDPEGHVRNAQNGIPAEPEELLFNPFGAQLYPILDPDGHQVTLQEWSTARGTSIITCDGTTSHYDISLTGLIPNGVTRSGIGYIRTQGNQEMTSAAQLRAGL